MKADNFRFSLPRGSQPVLPITFTGGFDWVDGNLQVTFGNSNHITLLAYEQSLARLLPTGGSISVAPVPGGWNIKFHYFGDK